MSVLCKFSSLSGVNQPANGRVNLNGCGSTRSSICKTPRHKQKQTKALRTASLNVSILRGRFSEVFEAMSKRGTNLWGTN